MSSMLTVLMWYSLAAVVVLSTDSLVMRWVEKGQPDPFRNLDHRASLARRHV